MEEKRGMRCTLVILSAMGCCLGSVAAEPFPSKPVRFIVPFVPGGGTDTFARITGAKLSEGWGQQVIVDNRGGAQGNIGTAMAAKAAPDGYTLVLAFVGTLAINPHLYRQPGFDALKDFAAVSRGSAEPWVITVRLSMPAKDIKELIAMAKRSPGKLNFASGSSGSQLAGELFKIAAGVDIVHVPYKGTAPATIDLLAGNVDMTLSIPTSVLSHIKAGRLRALAVTGSGRIEALPDVPSAMEAGLPQLNVLSWYGAVAPAATPPHILDQLNAGFVRALNSPDVRERMMAAGQMPAPSSREEFQRQIRADYEIWGKVVKGANLKAE